MLSVLMRLTDAYGAFFGLSHPLSKLLLVACTMIQPAVGLLGMICGLSVILGRRVLNFAPEGEHVEVVNGVLLGMLIGASYQLDPKAALCAIAGGFLIVLVSALLNETVAKFLRVPLLGLPYVVAAYILMPFFQYLSLPPAYSQHTLLAGLNLYFPGCSWLCPLGAIYFNGTVLGGIIVLSAFAISSRYLAALAIGGAIVCGLFTQAAGLHPDTLLSLLVRMNGVLTVCVLGGLYTAPGRRSLAVAIAGGVISCVLALTLSKLLPVFNLPMLALPFVLSCYLAFIALSPNRGGSWLTFWLSSPALPELSMEQMKQATTRGVDAASVALKAPFSGTWQVYQGFFGKHTHASPWQYALDFLQTDCGSSFKGQGANSSDYHCFGKPVLSPAYGRVVDFRSNIPDNTPGEVNTAENWGNYVLIRLDCGLYVMLAHLQKDSVRVALDARVVPGQMLALCGNSGRSPQPHLHMHVQEGFAIGSATVPFHLTGVVECTPEFSGYTLRSRPAERTLVTAPSRNAALKKALHLTAGNRLQFLVTERGSVATSATFAVNMDIAGQLWVESQQTGARVAVCANDDIVALFNRTGPDDRVLNAIILGISMTPLTEGASRWIDTVPRRLLPMPWFNRVIAAILSPFATCIESHYERKWDAVLKQWRQVGWHRLDGPIGWSCTTETYLCEASGVVKLRLSTNGRTVIDASLAAYGSQEDNGSAGLKAAAPALDFVG